jgi:hypothetical protein
LLPNKCLTGWLDVIETLPLFHRITGQPVIVLGEGDAAEAKRRLVERAGGLVCGEDCVAARLAFVALDEPEAAAERLRARARSTAAASAKGCKRPTRP